jgi:hypothetical protein
MGFLDRVWDSFNGIFRDDKDELVFFIIVFLFLLFSDKSGKIGCGGDDDFLVLFVVLFLIFFAKSFDSRLEENFGKPLY